MSEHNPHGIKPCVKCGAKWPEVDVRAVQRHTGAWMDERTGWVVDCKSCSFYDAHWHLDSESAVMEWNYRPGPIRIVKWLRDRQRRELKRLREELSRERQAHRETRRTRP